MAFEGLSEKLGQAFKKLKQKGRLKEEDIKGAMREVRLALLEADVNFKVAKDFVKAVTEKATGEEILASLTPAQQVIKIVRDEMTALMGSTQSRINFSAKKHTILMMCGLQGSGKTTHSAKLAKYFRAGGKRPLLVACDVYRPAAIEQLKVVGAKVNAPVFELGQGDPVHIAKEAVKHAKDYGYDPVILDTAGRLHIDEALMNELRAIKAAVHPHEILLVVDAMVGQDSVNVAQSFNEALGIDGVLLTKLDGDTRGGAALSVRAVTGKPIKFVGNGEKLEDLEPFYPDRMASRILGMGDMLTLIEKAENEVDKQSAMKTAQRIKENKFDMTDLLEQMKQIQSMGPLGQVLSMIPGVAGKLKDEDTERGEKELQKMEAIINSMTAAERAKPDIISPPRKRRIAKGSGTQVEDVNRLLKQYRQMQQLMRQFTGRKFKHKKKNPFGGFGMPNLPTT